MPILYIDNYRGFKNTYIPLKDVNFLVGENSTGKTSILSMIKILNSYDFWFLSLFNTEEINLGQFDEIVNKGNKSFSVGFLRENSDLFPSISEAVYMSFINDEGVPSVSELSLIYYNYNISIKIVNKNIVKYKIEKIKNDFLNIPTSISSFKQWIDHAKTPKRGFKTSTIDLINDSNLGTIIREILKEIIENIDNRIVPKPESRTTVTGRNANWIAPIRIKPKRIYESYNIHYSAEGEHLPEILRKMLNKKSESKETLEKDIFPFGEKSGLFKGIGLKQYGPGDLSPYEINITLDNDNQPFKICNVGYGVSQILPILINTTTMEHTWFLIQQPEIHLHPKAQAAIGDLIYDIHVANDKHFIIETHSEYLIDRFRMRLKENRSNNPCSQVLFFERTDTGNRVQPIEIENSGKYSENQPDSFTDFFIKEDLKLLEL